MTNGDSDRLLILEALIGRLGYDSRSVARAETLGSTAHVDWTPTTYMTANVVDRVGQHAALTAVSGSKKKPRFPPPVDRPDVSSSPKTLEEVDAIMAGA
ncbi:hypothetical protein [Kocuria rhizophila]|uniref:hypothetical protein n=1 Tax=Kocuria rhizophila TaxID=72000 RepID=UPI003D6ED3B3